MVACTGRTKVATTSEVDRIRTAFGVPRRGVQGHQADMATGKNRAVAQQHAGAVHTGALGLSGLVAHRGAVQRTDVQTREVQG